MKKTNICQHMLDLIEKEKNLQLDQNRALR